MKNDCEADGKIDADLRSLTLDHSLPTYTLGCHWDPKPNPKYLFSKVTALVGIARCPGLAVTFVTDSYTAKGTICKSNYFILTNATYF